MYGGILSSVNASHSYKHGDRDPAPTVFPYFLGLIKQRRRSVKWPQIKHKTVLLFLIRTGNKRGTRIEENVT